MMLLGSREAYALGLTAIGFRLFYFIYVDSPSALNSGWILALAGCALAMPMAVAITLTGKSYEASPAEFLNNAPGRVIFVLVTLFAVFDAAGSINLFSHSASYMALESIPTHWIRLTCVAAAALGCLGGLDAVGSTSRVWLRILFWLMLIVVVSILASLNANYLFPILGPGAKALSKPALACAGVVSSVFPIWLLREKPKSDVKRLSAASLCAVIGIVAAALLLLAGMMLPPILNSPANRTFQLDKLLTNGRVSVLLQLPLLFIWFGCYIASLSYSLVFAVHALGVCFKAIPRYIAILVCSLAALALSFTDITQTGVMSLMSVIKLITYYAVTLALVIERAYAKRRSARAV